MSVPNRFTQQAVLLSLVLAFLIQPMLVRADTLSSEDEMLTVMTRNVYVGANIFRVVEETDPLLILAAIAAVYQTTQDTDFPGRAEVLADEVLLHEPHVIGLQEVALVRRQSPGDVLVGNPVPATDVETDYLQLLLDALAARGLNYVVAASVDNADIELPLFGVTIDDIRLTDRDVLLVRADVPFGNTVAGNYRDQVIIDLSGTEIDFNRGYTQADVVVNNRTYRVFNTHLDVGSQSAIQALQAAELVGLHEATTLPLVLLGDFNSSPMSPAGSPFDQLSAAGYKDIWDNRSIDDTDPGFTCCHGETLDDLSSTFTSRIDLVWARSGNETILEPVEATVLGGNPAMLTAGGLWPSDHGGVVARFAFSGDVFDADNDGVGNSFDNCQFASNANQFDGDNDGFGNACDADFNQDGITNFLDLDYFRNVFLSNDPVADLNTDGTVDFKDLAVFRDLFLQAPGPRGLVS